MSDPPSFTIPATRVKQFQTHFKSTTGLRVGQAFHQFMQLEKLTSHREFCERLYQADDDKAWAIILSITDHQN